MARVDECNVEETDDEDDMAVPELEKAECGEDQM